VANAMAFVYRGRRGRRKGQGIIPVRIWACRQPEGLVKTQPEPYNKNSKYLKKLHIKVYKNIIQARRKGKCSLCHSTARFYH